MNAASLSIACLVILLTGCDPSAARKVDGQAESGDAAEGGTTSGSVEPSGVAQPRGLPQAVDTFGALAVDIDRVVLTERTPPPGDAAGTPTGTPASNSPDGGDPAGGGTAHHPPVWETSDPAWIADFIAAVGRDTRRTERTPSDCQPWADLTLYADQLARASFAVECPRGTFSTLRTRPPTHQFIARDDATMASLLQQLRGEAAVR